MSLSCKKNNLIALFPCFIFIPIIGMGLFKTGTRFYYEYDPHIFAKPNASHFSVVVTEAER